MKETFTSPDQLITYTHELMHQGCTYPDHSFHFFSLATTGSNQPQMRTVVLRKVNQGMTQLACHTDIRSHKVAEIQNNPNVALLFYCRELKLQCRFTAKASVDHPVDDTAWNALSTSSKGCYAYPVSSKTILTHPAKEHQFPIDKKDYHALGKQHMAILNCQAIDMDIVYLHHQGHIRVHATLNKENEWKGHFVAA